MNCQDHTLNPISLICVALHKCQRKLCVDCFYDHGVETKYLLPIQKFEAQLLKQKEELTQSHMNLKQMLSEREIFLKNLWENMNQSIQTIYDMIEREDEKYLKLIKFDISPQDLPQAQIDKLVNILSGNDLSIWNSEKSFQLRQLNQIDTLFIKETQKLIQSIQDQFQAVFWYNKTHQYDGLKKQFGGLKKIKFQIHINENRQLNYIHNGEIIYTLQQNVIFQKPNIIKNLEVLKHFKWIAVNGENSQKVGLWTALWRGERLIGCGGLYSVDGKKQGKWKEIIENYNDLAKVYEVGEYENNLRKGVWKYIYNDQEIGRGKYNNFGQKNGNWIEITKSFIEQSQVTLTGEYRNGNKIGKWDIWFKYQENNQKIGGGIYDSVGFGRKIGHWVEILDNFNNCKQMTWNGQYKNGKKIGRWDIWYKNKKNNEKMYKYNFQLKLIYLNLQSGGGYYDDAGNGIKIGNWLEISDDFDNDKQVTLNGEYKNGKKVGRWDIWYKNKENNEKIGGGYYDDAGNGIKIGNWLEISDDFDNDKQVTLNGEYKNGKKVGRWDIWYKNKENNEKIGGGYYDDAGNGIKIGNWLEISDDFDNDKQVTLNGEYKNGKKVGRWDIWYKNKENNEKMQKYNFQLKLIYLNLQSGGGYYDDAGNGIKIGNWLEISDDFDNDKQVTLNGEYKNGKKVGRWDIWYKNKENNEKMQKYNFQLKLIYLNLQSGGGYYDDAGNGIKIGNWLEISDDFDNDKQVTLNGEYKNGKKVGRWDIWYKNKENNEKMQKYNFQLKLIYLNLQSGGGYYDDAGNGIKIGNWLEISDDFDNDKQVTLNGEYKNGKKVGRWDIWYKNKENNEKMQKYNFQLKLIYLNLQSGGGYYDDAGNGIKIGNWLEISDDFDNDKQVTLNGEYKNGKKVGRWDIWYKNKENNEKMQKYNFQLKLIYLNLQSGGGYYDDAGNGIKIGNWLEISDDFDNDKQVTLNGEYKNGKKVGRWDIWYKNKENNEKMQKYNFQLKLIYLNLQSGGGYYDDAGNGIKIGNWLEISDDFDNDKQVTLNGEYKNGKKVGRWDIWYKNKENNEKMQKYNFQLKLIYLNLQSGGGYYDDAGKGIKIGNWLEISDGFFSNNQVTLNGVYKNGKKVGRWDIWFKNEGLNKKIGGGVYDDDGDGIKIGNWLEISDDFQEFLYIALSGEYKEGKKVGRWDIWYKNKENNEKMQKYNFQLKLIYLNKLSGGGVYDDAGDGIKIGNWLEISDDFNDYKQVTLNGEYKNGKKVGRWDIWFKNEEINQKIGGGLYDDAGDQQKTGNWVEISDDFDYYKQVTLNGEYENGKKVGRWDIWFKNEEINQMIGCGLYDDAGVQQKTGSWVEIPDGFYYCKSVTLNGEYKNGKKVGRWDIWFKNEEINQKMYKYLIQFLLKSNFQIQWWWII
ncbi:unnamed protein product [Paramecium octaurelia]|uniref:Uncharacterized protein n=1 Tax=Paramecium octaurelia TaxID=43137 RepID=A0A8S1VBR5_PAROT|nr:unnamed protein product [Paramecium octaurelia]